MREYISISGEIWTSSVGIGNENGVAHIIWKSIACIPKAYSQSHSTSGVSFQVIATQHSMSIHSHSLLNYSQTALMHPRDTKQMALTLERGVYLLWTILMK